MFNTNTYVRTNRCICCNETFKAKVFREYCPTCARAIKACLPASMILTPHEQRIPENELRARIDAAIDSYNS